MFAEKPAFFSVFAELGYGANNALNCPNVLQKLKAIKV